MKSQDLINAFREQLNQVEKQGLQQIQVSAIHSYLNALEKDADSSHEYRKLEHEGMLAHYAAQNQQNIEMLKAVLEAGKSALHYLVIINGGAVIALLGVMSNLAGDSSGTTLAKYLALPLLQFGMGVLIGAIGFALRYFSQAYYSNSINEKDNYQCWGDYFRYAAIVSALSGYLLFGFAMANAYHAVIWSFSS